MPERSWHYNFELIGPESASNGIGPSCAASNSAITRAANDYRHGLRAERPFSKHQEHKSLTVTDLSYNLSRFRILIFKVIRPLIAPVFLIYIWSEIIRKEQSLSSCF